MSERWSVVEPWVFRDKKYVVSADVQEDVLVLQVEEGLTAERWRAQFDSKHIEELTRKTGNFKKFPTFLNMMESAVTKSSESVTLDLLTYEDLEAMWDKKLGSSNRKGGLSPGGKPQAKRYLILTYNVEFDRIHYPLALPYCGRPDPIILQDTIRKLKAELDMTKKQTLEKHKNSTITQLKKQNSALLKRYEQLEEDFLSYKHEVPLVGGGKDSREIVILKKVIKNLEEELLKEHTKHQKYMSKKNREVKELLQEVEELRLSERLLQTRVKNLTIELNVLKKNCRMTPINRNISVARNISSRRRRSNSYDRDNDINSNRYRRRLSNSGEKRTLSSGSKSSSLKKRSLSPSGGRIPRFDPTAYIEKKKKEQHGLSRKIKVDVRSRSRSNSIDKLCLPPRSISNSSERSLNRNVHNRDMFTRTHSRETSCSRPSSTESNDRGRKGSPHAWNRLGSDGQNNESGLGITDIDARLNALQEFMKRSLESARK